MSLENTPYFIDFGDFELKILAFPDDALVADFRRIQTFIDDASTLAERNHRKDLMMGFIYGSGSSNGPLNSVELVKVFDTKTKEERVILRERSSKV
jgi:hypothetical protein